MNSIFVTLIAISLLYLGFRFYGSHIEHLWDIDHDRKTPAHTHHDRVDYVPAEHWTILFGHNFSSIAGAGPIIGPVIACAFFGWLPALIWIVIGTIFVGGVHDLSSLMSSIRHRGRSIAEVAQSIMGKRVKIIFALFLWLALILVIAVFAAVTANTLIAEPKVVFPTIVLMPIAIFFGYLVYNRKMHFGIATIIGIILMIGAIVGGFMWPITLPGGVNVWITILLIYAFIASVLPVNYLLQPRDYLSAYILFFGLAMGILGILVSHPAMKAPAFISWNTSQGPIWPMLFVIVACGAVSGFHSLVNSGTTSKQLANEKDAKIISYGGMVLEGVLAVVAVICVSAGLHWFDGTPGLVFPEIMKQEGWIVAFGKGFGQITMPILGSFGAIIAMTTLNSFVLTTLDTSTRITRYISEELFGDTFNIKIFKNRYASTLLVTLWAASLAFGNWKLLWPIFGASNQLVAALVLLVASAYLLACKKNTLYTLVPGIFMLTTAMAALVYQVVNFYLEKNLLLCGISAALLLLAIFFVIESINIIKRLKKHIH